MKGRPKPYLKRKRYKLMKQRLNRFQPPANKIEKEVLDVQT